MSCNINRNDIKQYLNDDNPPFMIEDCYSGESWNQPDFDDKCCGGGEELIMNTNYEDTLCIPTVQGGYCRGTSDDGDVKFFKYRETVTGTAVDNNLKKEIKPYIIQNPYVETPWNVDLADEISRPRDLYEDYTKDLQTELYNEIMIDRILRSSPEKIKENYDKEQVELLKLEDKELQVLINEIKKEEKFEEEEVDFIHILKIITLVTSILLLLYFIYNQYKHHKSRKSKNVFDIFDIKHHHHHHKVKHKKSKFNFFKKKSK